MGEKECDHLTLRILKTNPIIIGSYEILGRGTVRNAKSVTLSPENIRDIDLLSRLEGVSFSNLVDRVLQEYLHRPDVRERLTKATEVFQPAREDA